MQSLHGSLLGLVLAASLSPWLGCGSAQQRAHLSSTLREAVTRGEPTHDEAVVWSAVQAFHAQRDYAPAWVDIARPRESAGDALQVLNRAVEHGFQPEDYGKDDIVNLHAALNALDKDAPDRVAQLVAFETRLTTALLALGHDVALGRMNPSAIASTWKVQREPPDLATSLAKAVQRHRLRAWLDDVRPRHAEYVALQKAYADLRGQLAKGGWPHVPAGTFKRGASHPSVPVLRARLAASGLLDAGAASAGSPVFDKDVERAVKAFQELHGIKATGTVDRATLAAMNVPIEHRIRQVAMNLERWRWMPDDLGDRHLFVNMPQFHLIARENGRAVMDIRVVVGKPGNETPVFSDTMETVVFSPYWYIPDSIKAKEMAPSVLRDPGYLERNNIEVLRGAQPVDVETIDWEDPQSLRQLVFRQRPGASNALGHVKFLFPNELDVYLHDTPADSLFEQGGRAFSHGCVRVEEPEKLAQYLLRGQEEWNTTAIRQAMYSGQEQQVPLPEKIPVHLAYFTAWVDERGGLHFAPDVYGYDRKQASIESEGM
jgi:murein L,D-transpeptidase YcbB/YkuD